MTFLLQFYKFLGPKIPIFNKSQLSNHNSGMVTLIPNSKMNIVIKF